MATIQVLAFIVVVFLWFRLPIALLRLLFHQFQILLRWVDLPQQPLALLGQEPMMHAADRGLGSAVDDVVHDVGDAAVRLLDKVVRPQAALHLGFSDCCQLLLLDQLCVQISNAILGDFLHSLLDLVEHLLNILGLLKFYISLQAVVCII